MEPTDADDSPLSHHKSKPVKSQLKNNNAVAAKKKAGRQLEPQHAQSVAQFLGRLSQQYQTKQIDQKEQRIQAIKRHLVSLNHRHVPHFSTLLQQTLIDDYRNRLKTSPQPQSIYSESIEAFRELIRDSRACSVAVPIMSAITEEYQLFWQSNLTTLTPEEHHNLASLWKEVPLTNLPDFLEKLKIMPSFQRQPTNEFIEYLQVLLFEGRLKHAIDYYLLYTQNAQHEQQNVVALQKFEKEQLLPRITQKDQLFTPTVVHLLKQRPALTRVVFKSLGIVEYEKLVHATGQDVSQHPRVIEQAMKKHYEDIIHRFKHWFIVEDKLSYSNQYMEWFAKHLEKLFNKQKQSEDSDSSHHSDHIHLYGIESQSQALLISQSILQRSGNVNNLQQGQQIPNPLYSRDEFEPAQVLLNSIGCSMKQPQQNMEWLRINQQEVTFIGKLGSDFDTACASILQSTEVGIDSEFWPVTSKYEEGGISILQLAIKHRCYVFDYHQLQNTLQFADFVVELMGSPKIAKIGHTLSGDISLLQKTLHRSVKSSNLVDLSVLMKRDFPEQVYSSLAFLSRKFLGREICKYEQRSNRARRPLKLTQMHYAALDAKAPLMIYPLMTEQAAKNGIDLEKKPSYKQQKQGSGAVKGQIIFDHEQYQEYTAKPIFLIDNMLKKLCSTLRNCGLDAQYQAVKDYNLATAQSKKEKRIIVTRDNQLARRFHASAAIYLLKEQTSTDLMFQQLIKEFKVDLKQFKSLSRCNKCNNPQLVIIDREEAMKEIKFTYEDSDITQFWRCTRCRQIYWEGGQFRKAKDKYNALKK